MPANIKLTYFNFRGRAEASRLMLAYKGVDYEDNRITQEQWAALKPKTPFGSLPLLCYNGMELAQSMTIARFLARELCLAGKTRCEEAQVDMVVDAIVDLFAAFVKLISEKDEAKKAEMTKKMGEETVPAAMCNLEAILCKNGGCYMVGNDVRFSKFILKQFTDLLTFSRSLGLILKWLISLALLWRITEKSTLRTTRNCWLWSSASWTALTLRLGWRNAPRPTSKFTTSVTCRQQLSTVYKNVSFFPVSFSLYVFKA